MSEHRTKPYNADYSNNPHMGNLNCCGRIVYLQNSVLSAAIADVLLTQVYLLITSAEKVM